MKILLEKYFSKTTIKLLTILVATIILIVYFNAKSILRDLFYTHNIETIKYISYLLIILYIIFALISALVIYYTSRILFKNKDRSDLSVMITFGIYIAFALILLLNLQTIRFFFRLPSKLSGLLASRNRNFIKLLFNLVKVIVVPLIGIAVYNGFLITKNILYVIIKKKVIMLILRFKSYISTKRGIKSTITFVATTFIITAFIIIVSNQKTTIDLTQGVVVEISGIDGTATAKIVDNTWNYDGNSQDMESFLDSVIFQFDKSVDLSNGDEITLHAKYKDELANKYKVNPINTTKKIRVRKLDIEFNSYDDLSKKEKKIIEVTWDEYFKEKFNNEVEFRLLLRNAVLSDQKVVARYYANSDRNGNDVLAYLVKVHVKGNVFQQEEPIDSTQYFHINVSGITSSKLKEFDASTFQLLFTSNFKADSDEDAIHQLLEAYNGYKWDDYEMMEIE